jgi:hypothetical protein
VELDTVGWGITPLAEQYAPVADFLSDKAHRAHAKGMARFTQAFRAQYYQLAKRTLLEQTQVIDCYAGWASCQIGPNGDLWSCCIRAEGTGNLRDTTTTSPPSGSARRWPDAPLHRGQRVPCPMANASYANMLLHPPTLAKAALDVVR